MITSYNNDKKLKKDLIREMREHIKADHLIKGTYGKNNVPIEDFRGCNVGCAVTSVKHLYSKGNFPIDVSKIIVSDHSGLADALGLSGNVWLTRVYEYFFEYIPNDNHIQWSVDFLEAIPVGISPERIRAVYHRLMSYVLSELLDIKRLNDEGRDVINQVKDLHDCAAKGDNPVDTEWDAARDAALNTALTVSNSAWFALRAAEWAALTVSNTALNVVLSEALNAVLNEAQEELAVSNTELNAIQAERFAWDTVGGEKIQHYAETLLKLLRKAGE